jgi:hypothetical protein
MTSSSSALPVFGSVKGMMVVATVLLPHEGGIEGVVMFAFFLVQLVMRFIILFLIFPAWLEDWVLFPIHVLLGFFQAAETRLKSRS